MEEQGTDNANDEARWTDTQKHLVETTIKITGWGVAAGFIFAGWLMAGQSLDWAIKPGTCILVMVATAAISAVWWRVVRGAAQACQDAFPARCPTTDTCEDDPTRMVRRAPALALLVGIIVVLVATLACFDDMLDVKSPAPGESSKK